MDERLEKALAFGKYRASIENRRKAIQRRFETMLIVHHNNGMFHADMQTISFITTLVDEGHEHAIVIDTKMNPIDIDDLKGFRNILLNAYFAATNEFSDEIKKLAKARDVRKAMEW